MPKFKVWRPRPLRVLRTLPFILIIALALCFPANGAPVSQAAEGGTLQAALGMQLATTDEHRHWGPGQLVAGGHLILHDNLIQANHREPSAVRQGKVAIWSREPRGTQEPLSTVINETKTAILLTNGQQIKLYPLREDDLSPSGGYYVIKSMEQFNLSDSSVIESLEPTMPFYRWLKHKQQHMKRQLGANSVNITHLQPTTPIFPHREPEEPERARKLLRAKGSRSILDPVVSVNDDDLFASNHQTGWKRPLVSHVGHMFDDKFCHRARGKANSCLVVFWLDKRNKCLRYGSHQFTESNRIQLLSSRFDAHGNLRSFSNENKKTIWLHEFPPVNLCNRARELEPSMTLETCKVGDVVMDLANRNIHIELWREPIGEARNQHHDTMRTFSEKLQRTGISINYHLLASNRNKVTKLDEPATSTTTLNGACQIYWLNSNHELYLKDLVSQNIELVEKMSSKPAIRVPDELHSLRDTLFFNDLGTRSIMSINVTQRREVRKRQHKQYMTIMTNIVGDKRKLDTTHKLESTHQVLVVEPSIIESFNIVNFDGDLNGSTDCTPSETEAPEPRVIDDDLSENITRREIDTGYNDTMAHEAAQVALIVLVLILIWIVASRRTHQVDKLEVAQYNEVQT